VLKAYPNKCSDGVNLFLAICGCDESDFLYEEEETIDKYVWGDTPQASTEPNNEEVTT